MKISTNLTPSTAGPVADGGRARPAAGPARPAATSAGDQVALSSLSSRLQEIESSVAAEPTVDTKRVAEIKQAIAEGRFQINSDKIAGGLLDSVRDMLSKDRQQQG